MGADLRRLADHRRVDVGDHAAARTHGGRCGGEEDGGIRAFPLRVGWREMAADVAVAERAVDGVGDGMAQHVRVGMADEPAPVRHLEATEPDVVARAEGVTS